jgi:hypothetical protein
VQTYREVQTDIESCNTQFKHYTGICDSVSVRCVVFGQSKPAELVNKEKSMLIKFDLIKIRKGLTVKKTIL